MYLLLFFFKQTKKPPNSPPPTKPNPKTKKTPNIPPAPPFTQDDNSILVSFGVFSTPDAFLAGKEPIPAWPYEYPLNFLSVPPGAAAAAQSAE